MSLLHGLVLFLHVLSISVWLAAALWVAGDVRRTLASGRPHVDLLAARIRPALGVDAGAGLATIATGVLVMWEEALTRPRFGIAAGVLLALARLGLLAGIRGTCRSILARIRAGETVPASDSAARRVGMLSGMAHTAWVLALAGMVFPV